MPINRPEFKAHDDFIFEHKEVGKVTREEFIKYIRTSHEHMRKLSELIQQYNQTIEDYLNEWDGRFESFDDDVKDLLHLWIQDGTMDHIINENLMSTKADKSYVDDLNENVTAQLAQTSSQLDKKANMVKDVAGGQYLKPVRVPTLNTEKKFPNSRSPYTLLWVKDNEMYAYNGNDNTLRKSTDGGLLWETKGNNPRGFSNVNAFLKLDDGTLLTFSSPGGQQEIIRSVDDGKTWDVVFNTRPGTMALGSQSWAIDKVTGYVYFGEYFISNELETIVLHRSIDYGLTWSPFYTFKGGLSPDSDKIRHIHAVQWDYVDKRIVICTGDGSDYTGLWRVNAGGSGLEKILTNDMLSTTEMDIPRAIGIMPFNDYIAWAGDTSAHPYVFRIKRSDIGKQNIPVERIPYRLNSTAWFTCRASDDGSTWVISGSNEASSSLDNLVHLYAVEDQGATIWEVGSLPTNTNLVASL